MSDRATRQRAFLTDLLSAGHYRDLGKPGVWGRSSTFEAVLEGLTALVRRQYAVARPTEVAFSPLETLGVFESSGYVTSFPQLVGALHVFEGGDAEHKTLLHDREQGLPWDRHLVASDLMMASAACHPLYGMLAGSTVDEERYTVGGWCFRHEPSDDPFRTVTFRQREIVLLGTSDFVTSERDSWIERSKDLLEGLGLPVELEVASDPFFGRAGRLMARGQRQNALKLELTFDAYGTPGDRTALASGNAHGTHFSDVFDLRLPDGSRAHTACMGFGLERVVLALLRTHGTDVDAWPAPVRTALGLADHSPPPAPARPVAQVVIG